MEMGAWRRLADRVELSFPIRLKHRQGALLISQPEGAEPAGAVSRALLRAICLTRVWADRIATGANRRYHSRARNR
jgi:hypothetical protein